jgi:hypothetical protein
MKIDYELAETGSDLAISGGQIFTFGCDLREQLVIAGLSTG